MNFILAIPALVWLVASAIVFALGEYYSKKFALSPGWKLAIFVAFLYAMDAFLWLPAIFQKKDLVTTTLLWTVLSLVAIAVIGFFVFGEKISTTGAFGIFFAIVSIILLSI
jgi:multidrug transporter EmrE-like cation transporter